MKIGHTENARYYLLFYFRLLDSGACASNSNLFVEIPISNLVVLNEPQNTFGGGGELPCTTIMTINLLVEGSRYKCTIAGDLSVNDGNWNEVKGMAFFVDFCLSYR
jgi:hypothetical protein